MATMTFESEGTSRDERLTIAEDTRAARLHLEELIKVSSRTRADRIDDALRTIFVGAEPTPAELEMRRRGVVFYLPSAERDEPSG